MHRQTPVVILILKNVILFSNFDASVVRLNRHLARKNIRIDIEAVLSTMMEGKYQKINFNYLIII
ncbi:hypothetical protein AYK86_13140 [Acinetobacter venetianus]|nr:hypothetical protein AYK86_13140 [Acinetobacter venetianus]